MQTPRLTPSSSSDSSSFHKSKTKSERSNDRSILRGAAVVRETILARQSALSPTISEYSNHLKPTNPWITNDTTNTTKNYDTKNYDTKNYDTKNYDTKNINYRNTPTKNTTTKNYDNTNESWLVRSSPSRYSHKKTTTTTTTTSNDSRRDDDVSSWPENDEQHWANTALKPTGDYSSVGRTARSLLDSEEIRASPLGWSSISSCTDQSKESPLDWESLISDQSSAAPPPPTAAAATTTRSTGSLLSAETPVTTMGRGKSLRLKVYTYHVQPTDELGDDGTVRSEYEMNELLQDPAYRHAQQAGYLWQTIVGQHVKFSGRWWNGARSPRMGVDERLDFGGQRKPAFLWEYLSSERIPTNLRLTQLVKNRSCPGQLLLHIIVRDLMTWIPVQDICIGMYHPNARGVRTTESPQRQDEGSRDIWMAVRQRTDSSGSVVDALLGLGMPLVSPLGSRKVNNQNMRAVFGESPPVHTIFMLESELYERMTAAFEKDRSVTPARLLLREFLLAR